ncbi:hypothetical protein, partial [Acinetobacter sp. ANC 4193]
GVLTENYFDDPELTLYHKPEQTTLSFLYNYLNQEIRNTLDDDTVLIIFAGHGDYNSYLKTSYWYCSDSDGNDPTTWFNLRDLIDFFTASKAKHIALITDSCFSGAIFETVRGGGINALAKKKSRQALTSGGIETVSDGIAKNSPFNLTLIQVLSSYDKQELTFNTLSEETIRTFSEDSRQTPQFGALSHTGHEGGTYIFRKKQDNKKLAISEISLRLDIDPKIKIEADCKLPFFNDVNHLESNFINIYVQQLGYSIINEVRKYMVDDIDYAIERSEEIGFDSQISYKIMRDDKNYLSILIEVGQFFGTAYPNYWVETLNFSFDSVRKIQLGDLLDGDAKKIIENVIDKYSESDCKEVLKKCLTYELINDLEFSLIDKSIFLYFYKMLPHALAPCGCIEIPYNEEGFQI